jgi:hypothetical protein
VPIKKATPGRLCDALKNRQIHCASVRNCPFVSSAYLLSGELLSDRRIQYMVKAFPNTP